MTAWYQEPYRGGGPADVKGFPRPLYPPNVPESSGHEPSSKGPDVVGYKRTISRLGRWPWQAFDDRYSDTFAHGDPPYGHVERAQSGVAGVQRQQHIDATGWLGSKTFNALCYALVPDDPAFPHAGEQAMDSVAVDLINEAWEMFKGHEPAGSGGTVRAAALKRAQGQLGYSESPAGSNRNKYGAWYGMDGVPWCAIFASWAYEYGAADEGLDSPSFVKGSRYSYVPYIVADARGNDHGLQTVEDPKPGDLVCYDWSFDGEYDHVGLFENWTSGGNFEAIEGNTSTSNNSNGGQVMRRTRARGGQGTVFVRVREP